MTLTSFSVVAGYIVAVFPQYLMSRTAGLMQPITPSMISASEYPLETQASICLMRLMEPISSFWLSGQTWPCILNSFWKTLLRSSPVFSALTCRPKEVFLLPLILISCLPSPEKLTSDLVFSSSNLTFSNSSFCAFYQFFEIFLHFFKVFCCFFQCFHFLLLLLFHTFQNRGIFSQKRADFFQSLGGCIISNMLSYQFQKS